MSEISQLKEKIFQINNDNLHSIVWEVFEFQYQHNEVYRKFTDFLGLQPRKVDLGSYPFLPVELFKNHEVVSVSELPVLYFESSGTTGQVNSRHFIADAGIYETSFTKGFERVYGSPKDWVMIGLLPSYLERKNASLVYMVELLMRQSGRPENGFYLYDFAALQQTLLDCKAKNIPVMLFGVTFALLEFAAQFPGIYDQVTIIETGGMKGRGKELTRNELHRILSQQLQPKAIHSEYGMTELLSQAYSTDAGIFDCPPWMKVLKRDIYDPLLVNAQEGRGCINVIDLANVLSCSFIATQDIGKFYDDGRFEVLGRVDNSDIRGCNLLTANW
jgi:hypothetical protein